ncbi:semaphorin-4D-like isoform X1 [Chiloscyllium plagiosum]|uniref:semaphorin-4D-like isoform X1 n=1 Tax=Chiloscyllium plagiosum TaxID=36176 RepID=UPI001CB7E871|nr:semaphorin-4D-like isoform X1 [Chiloscyllium plagiosum]XP_043569845.1 semaphorin-4D-like isoform X1 [Chiloscyllium plagiosum]XP_043569856.1 semaphorin-4D-like isoform X1 [Chiloscyllium plagiosum]XP_043569865.1 semaphorin-4D-like isoform X1 [Chiloscyllium plagiosum]XP_043569873.1 semaphorin-4D-like isoform X1 [Chiloscyllium plagiosum]
MPSVILYLVLHLSAAWSDPVIPRMCWQYGEVPLITFSARGVSNYSTLLLSEDRGVLYVGAQEAIFAVNMSDISIKIHEVFWKVPQIKQRECAAKGKSEVTECLNYIRILHEFSNEKLYVCGTYAFQPTCDYLSIGNFILQGRNEEGKGKCPFDPAQRYTSVMVDGELYSGTVFNFLGSETVILRSHLRTEYAIPWLNEPSFVYSDVIRASENSLDGGDDKIYFFFTEVSVEYEFNSKLLVPRIARVCKGDNGGSRILQKRWTSFLKAKLICNLPESNFVFNVIQDVFILKTPNWKETVFYGVFTSQWSNLEVSAVCAFNMSNVEDVFSKGKYMQSATFEQSHVKWVRYNGQVPKPRPGSCINNEARALNINSSLMLPDKTLQFVKDHPLLADPVNPIGNRPKLVKKNANYMQIVVDRVRALDNDLYDVMFVGTDKGLLHKAINYGNEMHIIEEVQIFPDSEPVQTLLLSKEDKKYLYAGSHSGVVQAPVAFCEKYKTCTDCILARDPYCAWNTGNKSCDWITNNHTNKSSLIQSLNGFAIPCRAEDVESAISEEHHVDPGGFKELKCLPMSKLAKIIWKLNNNTLSENAKYRLVQNNLLIFSVNEDDSGTYDCWAVESMKGRLYEQLVQKYSLIVEGPSKVVTTSPTTPFAKMQGNSATTQTSTDQEQRSPHTLTPQIQTDMFTSTVPYTSVSPFSAPPLPNSVVDTQAISEPSTAESNDRVLLSLLVVITLLFLILICYNCYMKYLPDPCLKLRLCIVSNEKKPEFDYDVSEELVKHQAVKINSDNQGSEQIPAGDKGYETESDCGNGKIPSSEKAQELKQIQENHSIGSIDAEKDADIPDIKFIDEEVQSLC